MLWVFIQLLLDICLVFDCLVYLVWHVPRTRSLFHLAVNRKVQPLHSSFFMFCHKGSFLDLKTEFDSLPYNFRTCPPTRFTNYTTGSTILPGYQVSLRQAAWSDGLAVVTREPTQRAWDLSSTWTSPLTLKRRIERGISQNSIQSHPFRN
ncbi:hypothetical protein AcW1_005594 [Taiwanofungus camphoratus]|nr:hypothetical protein AcW1_005594 [Antrodia cinnamomea]